MHGPAKGYPLAAPSPNKQIFDKPLFASTTSVPDFHFETGPLDY